MTLPRQSTGLILNLPSERWSDIEYPYADLRKRNGAYPVEVDWPRGTDASASRSPPANPENTPHDTEAPKIENLNVRRHSVENKLGPARSPDGYRVNQAH